MGSGHVFEVDGGSFGLEDAGLLVHRFRAAILSYLGRSSSEILTGHQANGAPSARPHIAFTALANIDHRHADGSVKGLAVLLPRDMDDEDVVALESAASRVRTLHFGQRGSVSVFGLHPKPNKGLTEEDALMKDVERLGLPRPVAVSSQDVAFVRGAPHGCRFARAAIASARGRVAKHVRIQFDQPILGPLLLGAGRHMGFGLLLPVAP